MLEPEPPQAAVEVVQESKDELLSQVTGKEEMQLDHILSRGCKEYE
jgi:hypothetical protein